MTSLDGTRAAFIEAACAPLDRDHGSGTLDEANAILAEHPEIATHDVHTAAILGDDAGVRQFLDFDQTNATQKGGPRRWDALTHLCFSRYLRLDRSKSDGFVRAAKALLDAGANPNTGWFENSHQPRPEWESAIYGAAGVAHHAELTRLLLARGADPNDEETPYHAPETYDNAALKALVESGKLNEESLTTMLLRKTDWQDYHGIKWLLERGVDPNRTSRWGRTALQNAVLRDNNINIIEVLLNHGADPSLVVASSDRRPPASLGKSAIAMAARRGRSDVLALLERRGTPIDLDGVDRLIAACARNDGESIRSIAERQPLLVSELVMEGAKLLAEFAGVGNTDGVRQLLDLGVDPGRLYAGDPYFDLAYDSTALHVAAWRAKHPTLKLLIERGAHVDARDGKGRTPLALAVRACVDSYWMERRSPESVEALLRAGASVTNVPFPSGYAPVDELLKSYTQRKREGDMDRRAFLTTLGLVAATSQLDCASSARTASSTRRRLRRVGIQLYTLRDDAQRDLERTLGDIAAVGYNDVEMLGSRNNFGMPPARMRSILDRNGLRAPSTHVAGEALDDLDRQLAEAATLGHQYLVVASLPLGPNPTLDDYRHWADRLNEAGARALTHGVRIGFHNHAGDFTPIDGLIPYDVLMERTDAAMVRMQLDTGNLVMAGRDPFEYMKRFGSRYWLFHIKDVPRVGATSDTELGKGIIDFRRLLASIDHIDDKLLFVEQETYPGAPLDSARRDYAYLAALEF